ncbi:efflux transporter outer membrane subunit [Leptospira idonii]|uniref:Efflux transporter outer membrane subunit n=1 Tax=Leptospira idonii TaxID=1193500 RepID=A0A4R9M3G9_9LEPT|nr:efflux transporter outer membrane subunit [Leptospira idonii]TGN19338.1 efflux transporter outer membrane subunit [Leptospira idonii]
MLTQIQRAILIGFVLSFSGCLNGAFINLAPKYEPTQFVVPDSWQGDGPFVKANPGGEELPQDWWKLFGDPVLNQLEEEALVSNPDLQAAGERFLQARDMVMKSRSKLIPNLGIGFGASNNKQSEDALFRGPLDPTHDKNLTLGSFASWEPDFWSSIRNETWAKIYEAESVAAQYALARLSLQSELATDFFLLRGLDAKKETYDLSIQYYEKLLELVNQRFKGGLSPKIDVYRAEYLLKTTEARRFEILSQRKIIENAIAILVNRTPTQFHIPENSNLNAVRFKLPLLLPAKLLERRPDIASAERRMARANREIGIAKAAFFPNISFGLKGGFEGGKDLLNLSNGYWSYGSMASVPLFQGGYRRAQLQQAWSVYRETEDLYRSTVLNAFREVENNLTQTQYLYLETEKLEKAVEMAFLTQEMTTQLYTAGLSNSMEILYAQLSTLESKLSVVQVKTDFLTATVSLVRSLGGGWQKEHMPGDDEIQPFPVLGDPDKIQKSKDVPNPDLNEKKEKQDLTIPIPFPNGEIK